MNESRNPIFRNPSLFLWIVLLVLVQCEQRYFGPYDRQVIRLEPEWESISHSTAGAMPPFIQFKMSFTIPRGMAGKHVFLRMSRLPENAVIRVNGEEVLPVRLDQQGELQAVRINEMAIPGGSNELEVRVLSGSAESIHMEADLIALPAVYIRRVVVRPETGDNDSPDDDMISIQVDIVNGMDESQFVKIKNDVVLLSGGQHKRFSKRDVVIPAQFERTIYMDSLRWTSVHYSEPGESNFYMMKTFLAQEGHIIDNLATFFEFTSDIYETDGLKTKYTD